MKEIPFFDLTKDPLPPMRMEDMILAASPNLTQQVLDKMDLSLEEYQGKWKNLHFSKDGRSGLGKHTYDSCVVAKKNLDETILEFEAMPLTTTCIWDTLSGLINHRTEYSHSIQVPFKE